MADILGIFNHIQQQGEKGKQSRLGRMLGEAYNAPMGQRQEALGRIAQVDGGLAMQAGRQFREEDGEVLSQLSDNARQVVALYKSNPQMAQQMYQQAMLPLAQRAGITSAPQQLDDMTIQGLTQLADVNAKAGIPAGYQEFDMLARDANLSPEDRALAARRALYLDRRPSNAAMKYQAIPGEDGRERVFALDPNAPAAQQIGGSASYGAPAQAPMQAPQGIPPGVTPQQVQAAFQTIGARNGFEITSMQRPVMPGIGAGVNSQHPHGTAVDYRTRGKTPEQIAALIRDLESAGFEVTDESDGRTGTGPHIHAELPPGAGGAPAAADPFTSRRPEDETAATEAAKRSVGLQFAPAEAQAAADQARMVKGAELDVAREAEAPKRIAKYRQALATANNVEVSIGNALGMVGPWTTGKAGKIARGVWEGSTAYDLAAEVETIKANLGFDRLQEMRDNSPTGGALGQVAIQELVALQSTVANLDPNQSAEQLAANLERVRGHYARWKAAVEQAMADEQDFGGGDAAPSSDIDGLLGKYGIR